MKLPLIFLTLIAIGCTLLASHQSANAQVLEAVKTPVYKVKVVHSYPHDPNAFTQGLIYNDGFLYESTGLRGKSSLRKVELKTGKVLLIGRLDARLFAEGLAIWEKKLVQLTNSRD